MLDPTNPPPGTRTFSPNMISSDAMETDLGKMLAFRAAMFIRQVLLMLSGVSALFVLVKQQDWPGVAAWFEGHQGIATISVLAGAVAFIWGQVKTGRLKLRSHAFRAVIERLGLDSQALDPTDKSVADAAATPEHLIAGVVAAHPELAVASFAGLAPSIARAHAGTETVSSDDLNAEKRP